MTVKNGKFDVCTDCGANLDPGEQCDCEEDHQTEDEVKTE